MVRGGVKVRKFVVSVLLGMPITFVLLASFSSLTARAQQKAPLTYGFSSDVGRETIHYALSTGMVRSDAVEVKLFPQSIDALVMALGTKRYEVLETSSFGFLAARSRGVNLVIIGKGYRTIDGQYILVSKDSPLRGPQELRGKRVAISALGSTSVGLLRLVLKHKYQLNVDDVRWQEIPMSNISTVINRGQAEAGYTFQTASYRSLKTGLFKVLINVSKEFEELFKIEYIPSVFVTYRDVIEKSPAAIREFQRLLAASIDYGRAHANEVIPRIATERGLDPEMLQKWIDWNVGGGRLSDADIAAYQRQWKLAQDSGILPPQEVTADMFWKGYWE